MEEVRTRALPFQNRYLFLEGDGVGLLLTVIAWAIRHVGRHVKEEVDLRMRKLGRGRGLQSVAESAISEKGRVSYLATKLAGRLVAPWIALI